MKAFIKISTIALVTAAFGCSEQGPKKAAAEIWFYSANDRNQDVPDSTRQLQKHEELDSLVGEGSFVEAGLSHTVRAYSNGHTCGPHSCAVTLELDTIGCFYRRSMEGWTRKVWHSSSDSLNRLFDLALEKARDDSFLINKRYGVYLRMYSGLTDFGDHIPNMSDVDSIPEFPGGHESLLTFMHKALLYPDSEWNANVQGKNFVEFVVEPDGKTSQLAILRSLTPALDSASIRAVRSMPRWKPARIQDKPVPCQMVLPIIWKITEKGGS